MKSIFTLTLVLTLPAVLLANDIKVTNVTLTGQDPGAQTTMVQFDLSWDNSWRVSQGPSNWDAAWIFIKFRENGGPWEHAQLNRVDGTAANDGHTQPTGSIINTPIDAKGCFIYRGADGSGTVNWTGIQLKWNYGWSSVPNDAMIDVQVFAIEMVYIPTGAFNLGSQATGLQGSTEVDKLYKYSGTSFKYQYTIYNENAINIGTSIYGSMYYTITAANSAASPSPGIIPAAFPKGYAAFYVMKYEVSEEQWVGFFNTLTEDQKPAYDITRPASKNSDGVVNRNTISYTSGQTATTAAPARAVNYIGWFEMSGYLCWAALRPFTELEYEKMARGSHAGNTTSSVINEYAWGNNLIHSFQYTVTADGTENAVISNPGPGVGNANYLDTKTSPQGPMKVGIFAASAITKNREETGASYYGVMELSGNLLERCMSVGHADNRSFSGIHGYGTISNYPPYGHTVNSHWPSAINIYGARSYRGGCFANPSSFLRVSDRELGCYNVDIHDERTGARGARTAE